MAKVNFTTARVAAYKCENGKDQSFIWDSGCPGLGLRATKNGASAYIFQARLSGNKEMRMTIGDSATWQLGEARAEANRLKVLVDQDIDPRQVKADKHASEMRSNAKQTLLARTAWDAYMAVPHPRWGSTHRQDHVNAAQAGGTECKIGKRQAKPGPLAALLKMPLNSITSSAVENWLITESKTRATSAKNALRKFVTFIGWCSTHATYKHIAHADCCRTPGVKTVTPTSKAKVDHLLLEQLKPWFAAINTIENRQFNAYLQCLLLTGARSIEMKELRWTNVDFKWKKLTIGDKNDGSRNIPLTPYVEQLLKSLPEDNEWVFSSPTAESGHIVSPTKSYKAALKRAGLPLVTLHGLRRSFGTLALWIEAPAGVTAQIMGHKPSAIQEKHYIIRPIDYLRRWHDRIEAFILEQANGSVKG